MRRRASGVTAVAAFPANVLPPGTTVRQDSKRRSTRLAVAGTSRAREGIREATALAENRVSGPRRLRADQRRGRGRRRSIATAPELPVDTRDGGGCAIVGGQQSGSCSGYSEFTAAPLRKQRHLQPGQPHLRGSDCNGGFAFTERFDTPGAHTVRAVYAGDGEPSELDRGCRVQGRVTREKTFSVRKRVVTDAPGLLTARGHAFARP